MAYYVPPQLIEWAMRTAKTTLGNSRIDRLERRQMEAINKLAAMAGTPSALDAGTPAAANSSPSLLIAQDTPEDTDRTRRVRKACITKGLRSARLLHVPSDYYKRGLTYRRDCLKAPSIDYLCKTVILENTHWAPDATPSVKSPGGDAGSLNDAARLNAQYYAVVIQYVRSKVRTEKMAEAWQVLNPGVGKKKFNFRMAQPDIAERMTSYSFGGIVPLGMSEEIPIVIDQRIAEGSALKAGFFYLGGGEVDWKLRVNVKEFVSMLNPIVADVTAPIPADEVDAMAKGEVDADAM